MCLYRPDHPPYAWPGVVLTMGSTTPTSTPVPTPTPTPTPTIPPPWGAFHQLGVSYWRAKTIVTTEIDYGLPGRCRLLIEAIADVQVGVDLSQVKPEDVRIDGSTVKITLPRAKILSIDLKPELVSVYESDYPLAARCDGLELQALSQARPQLWEETLSNPNSLAMAERLVTEQLTEFLGFLGFSQIVITFE